VPNRGAFIKLAALSAFGAASAAPARAQELHTVRVLELPTDGAKSVLYAQKAGLFRKRGIDAAIVAMGSGAAIYAAIVGGSADIGSGSLWPVYQAYARGLPLRIIAPASVYTSARPDAFLLVRKDSPYRVPRDLNGKIIGGDAVNDIGIAATRAWIDQHGGDGKSLRTVELKPTEQLAALDAGRIDMATLKPPYLTLAQSSGKFRVLGAPYDAIAPLYLVSCWVATVDYIAKNPGIVNGFVAGLTEAARYTNAHQAETIGLVAAFTGQDPLQLADTQRSTTAETVTLAELQAPLDFANKWGIITQHIDLNGILAPSMPLVRR
jgi:ABC-type nitrate/sulfonate/bicarbonate transport system substrate-binding protein